MDEVQNTEASIVETKKFNDYGNEVNVNDIVKMADSNIDRYLEYKGWNKKKRQAFLDTYKTIISDISSGKINARSAGKKWTGTSQNLQNIEDGFDAVGEVLHFLNPVVDKASSTILSNKEQFAPSAFRKYFNNLMFGGVDPSLAQWNAWRNLDVDDKDGNRLKIVRAKKLAEMIPGYIEDIKNKKYDFTNTAFGNEDTYISRLQHAQLVLSNDTFDDEDIRAFNQLGIDISNFLSDSNEGTLVDTLKKEAEEAQKKADAENPEKINQLQLEELVKYLQGTYGDKLNFKGYSATIVNKSKSYNPTAEYDRDTTLEIIGKELSKEGYSPNLKKLYNNLTRYQIFQEAIQNGSKKLWDNGDGSYYIAHSYNTNDNSGWTVKLTTEGGIKIEKKRLSQIPGFRLWARKKYAESKLPGGSNIWLRKNGGILKASDGAQMPELSPEEVLYLYQYYLANQQPLLTKVPTYFEQLAGQPLPWETIESSSPITSEQIKAMQQEKDAIAKSKGYKNEKQQKEYQRKLGSPISEYDWKGEDWVELGAIGADIVSLVSAWIPGYGTVVSAATGVAGTTARLGADISRDGFDMGDLGRFAWGLGADVAGLIPGLGSGAKAGKITKSLSKFLPWLMGIASVGSLGTTGAMAMPALKKLGSDEKLTVEDWKNLGNLLVAITGASNAAASSLKTKAMMNQAKSVGENKPASILTKDGREVTLTPEQLNSIRGALGLDGKNAALRAITGNATDEVQTTSKFLGYGTKFNESSITDAQTIPGYDFTKLDPRWLRGGYWSDAALLQRRMNFNLTGSDSWNPYNKLGTSSILTPATPSTVSTTPVITPTSFTQWLIAPNGLLFPQYASRLPMVLRANGAARITPLQAQQWNLNDFHAGWLTGSGKAYWWKEGGKIPFYLNGGYTNVQRKDNYVYPAKELAALTIARLKNGEEDVNTFNSKQHEHSIYRNKYDKEKTGKFKELTGIDSDVQGYQGWFNLSGYNEPIWSNYSMFDILGKPITGATTNDRKDGYSADGLYGAITDTRHRGRKEDFENNPELLAEIKKMYNDAGYEYELDESDNYYKLKLKKSSENTDDEIKENEAYGRTDDSDKQRKQNTQRLFDGIKRNLPEIIPAASLADSIRHNNKVHDILKNSMHPLLTDTYTLNHPIFGNLAARNFHENEAAKILNYTTNARTSDATLNALTALEGLSKASQEREKGYEKDNARIEETRKDALTIQDDNTKRRSENANANRARLTDYKASLGELDAQHETSNYNSRDQFRKELYNKFISRQNKEDEFYNLYYSTMAMKPEDDPVVKAAAVKWTQNQTPENYEEYQAAVQLALKRYFENYFRNMGSRYGYSIPILMDSEFQYMKSGGAIEEKKLLHKKRNDKRKNDIKDNELFHKNSRHSKSEHDKNMRHTTNGIQELFKRSTDLKRK